MSLHIEDENPVHRRMRSLENRFSPVWDPSPNDVATPPLPLDDSESSVRKFRVSILLARTCWRLHWSLQRERRQVEFRISPLSRLRTCVYLIVAVSRLKLTLPQLRTKREQALNFLLKLQPAQKWVDNPLLHVFRSTAYGVLFAIRISSKVYRNHAEFAPLNVAMNTISAASKVRLDDSLNSGKCKVLLQFLSILGNYLSMFRFILDNNPKQSTRRLEGLSACYYILEEMCRLLRQCMQYMRDCSGNFPSRKVFAKLESVSTVKGLIFELDRCLQLLSIKVDYLVEKNFLPGDSGSKLIALRLSRPCLDYYLQLQAEKDQSDLLIKLKQSAKSLWPGLTTWKSKPESELLIARMEYDQKDGQEIDYLKRGLYVDPKNVKVVRSLREGSYGKVYEVMCFGERYAMKTIVSDLENANELILHARLEHPNIVKLVWYTADEDPKNNSSTLSLLMEFMDVGLDVYLEQRNHHNRPPLAKYQLIALHILLQIARAMAYLHSQGIMHRDLKAANVLVDLCWSPDFRDGYLHVKICDFGLSKLKQAGAAGAKKDLNTAKVGTRHWRAPEVLKPDFSSISTDEAAEDVELARYSFSADVYSYAMTCYEVLSGKKPFAEHKQGGLKERIVTMNERPSLPEDDLHPGLVDLIKRCWDGRPEARPSFEMICEELEGVKKELLFGRR